MAIRQLRKVVERLLLDGHSVQLGNWGTFGVTLTTEGVATKNELSASQVKKVNINFQPGESLKTAMQKAEFVWLDKLVASPTPDSGGGEEEPDRPAEI